MIEYKDGLHLKGTGLWFDAKKKTELSFISCADPANFTAPNKIIATPGTIKLLEKKVSRASLLSCPYNRTFTLGNLEIELVPSGHMLGSAQMLINKGDQKILYSGDINFDKIPTAESIAVKKADVLILKCGNNSLRSSSCNFDESLGILTKFIDDAFSSNQTPVVFARPLGIAEDIIKCLDEKGYKISLDKSIYQATKVYESFGYNFGDCELYKKSNLTNRVLFLSYENTKSSDINSLKNKRAVVITENGLYDGGIYQDVDIFVEFSSKADRDSMLEYVKKVNPQKIYLIDRNAQDFAKLLDNKNYEVVVLEKPTQLDLL